MLNERAPGYQPGDSEPEKRIAELLVRAGLPRPKLGHHLRIARKTIRLDIAYVEPGSASSTTRRGSTRASARSRAIVNATSNSS